MKPFPQYPKPKSWEQWKFEMALFTSFAIECVAAGDAERAGYFATAAVHAAFYV